MRVGHPLAGASASFDGLLGAALAVALALGLAWLVSVIVLQTPGVRELPPRRSSARRSSSELNEVLPSDTRAQGARALRPVPAHRRARRSTSAPPRRRSRAIPTSQRAGDSVVQVLGNACGLGVSGSGWVAGDGHRRDERPRRRRRRTTRVVEPRGGGERLDATAIAFDSQATTSRCCACAGSTRAGAAVRARGQGHRAGRGRRAIPLNGPFQIRAGARRADARRARAGRLRAAAGAAQDHGVPRRRAARQLRRPDRRRRRARLGDGLREVRRRRAAGGYAVPNDIVARALASAGGPVGTGPCVR